MRPARVWLHAVFFCQLLFPSTAALHATLWWLQHLFKSMRIWACFTLSLDETIIKTGGGRRAELKDIASSGLRNRKASLGEAAAPRAWLSRMEKLSEITLHTATTTTLIQWKLSQSGSGEVLPLSRKAWLHVAQSLLGLLMINAAQPHGRQAR